MKMLFAWKEDPFCDLWISGEGLYRFGAPRDSKFNKNTSVLDSILKNSRYNEQEAREFFTMFGLTETYTRKTK